MKLLLTLTALIEAGTGLALLTAPAIVVQLLLGAEVSGAAIPLGRLVGVALLALALACWRARSDVSAAARGLVAAMLLYNIGAVVVLGTGGLQLPTATILLWLAVALHAGMAAWCVAILRRSRDSDQIASNPRLQM
jgi:hypothetical protein